MEFPITRERLHAYRRDQSYPLIIKQLVKQEINKICHDVERQVLNGRDTKFIYRFGFDIKHYPPQSMGYINKLLEAIKYNFPDSAITVDPLESYIIIDWS